MNTQKQKSILLSSLECVLAGIFSGLAITLLLSLAVLLIASYAHAGTPNDEFAKDEMLVRNPSDVKQGTLLFKNNQDYSQAPVLNTDVSINVKGMIARVTVKQHFKNPDADWKEGIYVFPLPQDAAVDHMRLHIGKRIIEGQIKEKAEARKQYEKARKQGKKASLVEQERPNIFTTSVANIGPNEEITVEIEYQEIVRYDSGTFHLRFPMVVAPRYIPGNTTITGFSGTGWAVNTDQVPDAARITPPVLHPDNGKINPVSLQINLDAGFLLPRIESSYHAIDVEQTGDTQYKISLRKADIPADRDFELTWQPEKNNIPQAALFTEDKEGKTYALIMVLPPDQANSKTLNREVIFVIDTSGSMSGPSIVQAKQALELALSRLKPGDRFNVIQFNSFTHKLFQFSQPVTHQSLRQARQYVAALRAQGGTEMASALRAALEQQENGYDVRQVVFLTDGSIGNEDKLFKIITQHLGDSRLFTVGIGSAPNSYFMNRAANFGRGTHTYIGKVDEVQEKMEVLFRKLESPVLTDLKLNWSDNNNVESWPQKIPDLYLGEPLLISARASSFPENFEINGAIAGAPWNASLKLTGGQQKSGVSVLWARKKIAGLMKQRHSNTEKDTIRKEIIETAIEHHLVSKYTSLIAVDITPARARDEILKSHALPVNLPAGWNYEKVFGKMPGTATSAQLNFIIGFILLFTSLLIGLTRKNVFNV
ncbi:MAG: marine proteobacterial sortase target protein [Gammaproteobacteria bacterium]